MIKNIFVVDEQGNYYEATYPKRARGLVKTGRARFLSENKICLACPPNRDLEERTMTEKMPEEMLETSSMQSRMNGNKNTEAVTEAVFAAPSKEAKAVSFTDIFARITKLQDELQNIKESIDSIERVRDNKESNNGMVIFEVNPEVAIAKTRAIVEIFKTREETIQKMLLLYGKMCEEVK